MKKILGNKNNYVNVNKIENLVDMDFIEDDTDKDKNIRNTIEEYLKRNKTNYLEIRAKNNLL